MKLATHYGNDRRTVEMAKYAQALIGFGNAIRATKHGSNHASSAIDTKLRLLTSSLIAVMISIVILDPTMYGMESKLV